MDASKDKKPDAPKPPVEVHTQTLLLGTPLLTQNSGTPSPPSKKLSPIKNSGLLSSSPARPASIAT